LTRALQKEETVEFFTVCCLRNGKVSLDGSYLGDSRNGDKLRVFQCVTGLHDISLECRIGRKCLEMTQRVMMSGTNPFMPKRLSFFCRL
jgi:hypothetical protein